MVVVSIQYSVECHVQYGQSLAFSPEKYKPQVNAEAAFLQHYI